MVSIGANLDADAGASIDGAPEVGALAGIWVFDAWPHGNVFEADSWVSCMLSVEAYEEWVVFL